MDRIDLGDGHAIVFSDYKDEKHVGGNVLHQPVEGKCDGQGWVAFEDTSWSRGFANIATWKVEQTEPLTLSPSILCRACGDHGFIRGGKWERA
ncbi:MAG: hypothetical protein JWR21_853 [Herminiimonas sp.]|nr:hypothetical protein [Herminiimonas sp.]